MHVAVVGAGPAGLTAAYRLLQAGHEPTVFEAMPVVGGRTHAAHHGPGHWTDDGAGWLASFYPDTLALLDELGLRGILRELSLRGGGDLLLNGALQPNPNSVRRILGTTLLRPSEKIRFVAWMAQLFLTQRGELRVDMGWDARTARTGLASIGRAAADVVVRPSFEGPFFSRLEDLSAALVRSWLRALSVGTFFQVDGGMDTPWRHLGEIVGVRTGSRVDRLVRTGNGVEVHLADSVERFDGVVVAVPAPLAVQLVDGADLPEAVRGVQYAPHVRLYAARRGPGRPRTGIHALPNDVVATVEQGSGGDGSWGRVPPGWEWALVCAPAASSAGLVPMPDAELASTLWAAGTAIDPSLFPLETAEITHLVRWPHAVPVVRPGYFAPLRALRQQPPIVFAGDWLVQPCVEGAVRSGKIAAAAFGSARQ